MLPTDIEIREVHEHEFVKRLFEMFEEGYVVKSYDQSLYMPHFNGTYHYCVMSPRNVVTEQEAPVQKQKPVPPIRKPKQPS